MSSNPTANDTKIQEKLHARATSAAGALKRLRGVSVDLYRAGLVLLLEQLQAEGVPPLLRLVPERARAARPVSTSKRIRRSPSALIEIADRVAEYIKANPGLLIGAISAGVGIPIPGLRTIMAMLKQQNRIAMKGQKVHMTYYPAPEKKARAARASGPGLAKAAPHAKAAPKAKVA